ncbi:MAG: hypothetical protein ORN49_12315, partial [Rhodobacteraceae bacterium]|nr:hypothetical protein [Paracoccaceae bacterium]
QPIKDIFTDGGLLRDDFGEIVYQRTTLLDLNGNPVPEVDLVYVPGTTTAVDGAALFSNGRVEITGNDHILTPVLDANHQPTYQKDANGQFILDANHQKIPVLDGHWSQAQSFINQGAGRVESFGGDILIAANTIRNLISAPVVISAAAPNGPLQQVGFNTSGDCEGQFQKCNRFYDYRQLYEQHVASQGQRSEIVSGGTITLMGGTLLNDYSVISASKDIRLNLSGVTNTGQEYGASATTYTDQYYFKRRHFGGKTRFIGRYNYAQTYIGGQYVHGTIEAGGDIQGTVTGFVANGAVKEFTLPTNQGQAYVDPRAGTRASPTGGSDTANSTGQARDDVFVAPGAGDLQILVPQINLGGIDSSGLYVTNTDPNARYLVETRYKFIDLKSFLSSDYFFDRLGINPNTIGRQYGDAMVETDLIRNQIFAATGSRILSPDLSEKDQIKALYDNALLARTSLGLRPGVTLTPAQAAKLTSNILWMEERVVNGQKVLVPQLYLALSDHDRAQLAGAQIRAGGSIALKVGGLQNGGAISAGKDLILNAKNDIVNQGYIGGGIGQTDEKTGAQKDGLTYKRNYVTVLDSTDGNYAQIGGIVSGTNVQISANDVFLSTEKLSTDIAFKGASTGQGHYEYAGDSATLKAAGNLSISADKTLTASGAALSAGGTVGILAKGDIALDPLAFNSKAHLDYRGGTSDYAETRNLVTSIDGKNVSVISTGEWGYEYDKDGKLIDGANVSLTGTKITAQDKLEITAYGGNVTFGAAQDVFSFDFSLTTSGFLSKSSYHSQDFDLTNQTANLNAGTIDVRAAGNVTAVGTRFETHATPAGPLTNADAAKAGSLNVTAGGDVSFYAVTDIHAKRVEEHNSILGGLLSSSSNSQSLIADMQGAAVAVKSDINLTATEGSILLQGGSYQADGAFNPQAQGGVYLQGIVDSDYDFLQTTNNNGLTITTKTSVSMVQTGEFPTITAAANGLVTDLDGTGAGVRPSALLGGRATDPVTGALLPGQAGPQYTSGLIGQYGPAGLLEASSYEGSGGRMLVADLSLRGEAIASGAVRPLAGGGGGSGQSWQDQMVAQYGGQSVTLGLPGAADGLGTA